MKEIDAIAESTEKLSAALSNLVPQLFFDVIARLIPGFIIIWSFYFSVLNLDILTNDNIKYLESLLPDNQFFLFLISAILFYVTSVIFYGLWSATIFFVSWLLPYNEMIIHRFLEVLKAPYEFTLRHDFIKLYAPGAGNRITKLKAEIHMSGSLTVAFIICLLMTIAAIRQHNQIPPYLIYLALFYLFGAIGLFFSNRHFSIRLCRAVNSYSELLGYEHNEYSMPDKHEC